MPRTETVTVYQYNELNDAAKAVARQWWIDGEQREGDNSWAEFTIADFKEQAKLLGWNVTQTYWSGFSSQGDGACFEGDWSMERVNVAALRANVPRGQGKDFKQNNRLNDIADMFEVMVTILKDANVTQATGDVKHRGHYMHSRCTEFNYATDVDLDITDVVYLEYMDTFVENTRALMDWFYNTLEAEYNYRLSDEQVADTIIANEYEFTADGKRYKY